MAQNDIKSLLDKVAAACETVDNHVLHSHFFRKGIFTAGGDQVPLRFDYSDPEAYLKDDDALGFLNRYFQYTLQQWDRHVDGEPLNETQYNSIVEQLSIPPAALDRYAPLLVQEYRKKLNVPERVVQRVLRRHSALNAFLNSADIGLQHRWLHQGM
ncbi:hypothetical protein H2201_006454 [Coniosporium apollinis]|uniref:Uncharacterized protein n=1 Tax=Coniosporium apollinis TaxID=61459 RepID=A0ABQ9NNL0_9PEZI|nr:hypothetical protein H2201_006454 [Coniosporium apollinis]